MPNITPKQASAFTLALCNRAPVIPVLIIENHETAAKLGLALMRGGLPILEVTLRTESALQSIRSLADIEGGIVGAGTVLTAEDAQQAQDAGAQFAVSPGATDNLIAACEAIGLPLLAGASTASEAMKLLERGYSVQKFFPAEAAGGAQFIKSLASPLPQITFCPTGGVSLSKAVDYLSAQNVRCVGGSWVAPKNAINNGEWDTIRQLATEAVAQLS